METSQIDKISKYLTFILTVAGVVVTLLNLWLINGVSPIYSRLDKLDGRVYALEERYKSDMTEIKQNLSDLVKLHLTNY